MPYLYFQNQVNSAMKLNILNEGNPIIRYRFRFRRAAKPKKSKPSEPWKYCNTITGYSTLENLPFLFGI